MSLITWKTERLIDLSDTKQIGFYICNEKPELKMVEVIYPNPNFEPGKTRFLNRTKIPWFDPTNYTDQQIIDRVKNLLVFL